MHDLEQALARIEQVFSSAFGVTSLQQRIQDLLSQSLAVSRFRDEQHLQREVGDLLCSVPPALQRAWLAARATDRPNPGEDRTSHGGLSTAGAQTARRTDRCRL